MPTLRRKTVKMKHVHLFLCMTALALFVASSPASAQRDRGPSGNPGASHADMSHGASANNPNSTGHGPNSSNAGPKSATELLSDNPKLDTKLTSKLQSQGLLAKGTDLSQACKGFRNLGQCIAAIHVSHNLGITFACLRADMTGQLPLKTDGCPTNTGTSKMSLGKAITTLSPTADAKGATKNGQKQADADIKEGNS